MTGQFQDFKPVPNGLDYSQEDGDENLGKYNRFVTASQGVVDKLNSLFSTNLIAGVGLSGGGTFADNITVEVGLPSEATITGASSSSSETHTHKILTPTQQTAEAGSDDVAFSTPLSAYQTTSARVASQIQSEEGLSTTTLVTPERLAQQLDYRIATNTEVVEATSTVKLVIGSGVVHYHTEMKASNVETIAGTDNMKMVTKAGVEAYLSDDETDVLIADNTLSRVYSFLDGRLQKPQLTSGGFNTNTSITHSPELSIYLVVSSDGTDRVRFIPDNSPTWQPTDWTTVTVPTEEWQTVTWSSDLGIFVALASTGANRVMVSSDGQNWTSYPGAPSTAGVATWSKVIWSKRVQRFIAVAKNGYIMVSEDGVNWSSTTAPSVSDWEDVTESNSRFVAVASGGGNRVMTSTDGLNWSTVIAPTRQHKSVTWSDKFNLFLAVSTDGADQVMTSTDGSTWVSSPIGVTGDWGSVTWSSELEMFIVSNNNPVVGEVKFAYSRDITNWQPINYTRTGSWQSLYWCKVRGQFLAVSGDAIDTVIRILHRW